MIGFIRKIKEFYNLSKRLTFIESELNELDARLEKSVHEYSKQFEKKIQSMTCAYTKNLDDTKSDYLKRYLEVRMDCMQQELSAIPNKIAKLQSEINNIDLRIEHQEY